MAKAKAKPNPELLKIGKQVDPQQLKFVMNEVKNWVHFVGMDETALAQVAGIILVAGEKYKKESSKISATVIDKNGSTQNKKIDLFDPATYG